MGYITIDINIHTASRFNRYEQLYTNFFTYVCVGMYGYCRLEARKDSNFTLKVAHM